MNRGTFAKGDDYFSNLGEDLRRLIPAEAKTILDIGCGRGLIGKKLKEERGVEVVGIESNPEAAEVAKRNLDRVYIEDVEEAGLHLEKGYFDCIIFGDVLEHLADPWSALRNMGEFLRSGGCIVASVPNVGHWSILKGLLSGRWDYRSEGILDIAHLRFFTLNSLKKYFKEAGFDIETISCRLSCAKLFKKVNSILGGPFTHLLAWQYLIVARKPNRCFEKFATS